MTTTKEEKDDIYNRKFKNLVEARDLTTFNIENKPKVQNSEADPSPDDVWIFGYGSLMWKVDFPYIDWKRGYICGYLRRFFQNSIDHRGTRKKPGRVVTLITGNSSDRVYGVAYRIAAKDKERVFQHLDFREKNGYNREIVKFHVYSENTNDDTNENGDNFSLIIYIANISNESWAGCIHGSKIDNIAKQIFTSAGPSGVNREYLFNLGHSMEVLFPNVKDQHLIDLEKAVRKLIEDEEIVLLETGLKKELDSILKNHLLESDNEITSKKLNELINFCSKPGWREHFLAKEMYTADITNIESEEDITL